MNYRKRCLEYYLDTYNSLFNFPAEYAEYWDVHHIDNDHNNNDMKNLVLIPHELHQKYHTLRRTAIMCQLPDRMFGNEVSTILYESNSISNYLSCLEECMIYMDYKKMADYKIRSTQK